MLSAMAKLLRQVIAAEQEVRFADQILNILFYCNKGVEEQQRCRGMSLSDLLSCTALRPQIISPPPLPLLCAEDTCSSFLHTKKRNLTFLTSSSSSSMQHLQECLARRTTSTHCFERPVVFSETRRERKKRKREGKI